MLKPLNLFLLLSLLTLTGQTQALQVSDLYQAQVKAGGRTPAHQRQAMADALREVIVKVSGRSDVSEEQLAGVLKNAEQYVQSYGYEGGARGQALYLRAQFDSVALNGALRQAGIPVWTSNRPQVLVWMVIEDNGQRRIVSPELDAAITEQVARNGARRGLPLTLPLYDVQDMENISAADIWGGFMDRVKAASDRYHPEITIIGKIHKAGLLWQGDWQIISLGNTLSQEFTGPDAPSVVGPGLEWLTNEVASVYSGGSTALAGAGAGQAVTIKVTDVDTLKDYAALLAYLNRLVVIRESHLKEVAADAVTLSLTLETQADTMLQTLKEDGKLRQIAAEPAPPVEPATAPGSSLEAGGAAAATSADVPAPPAAPVVMEFEWHG